MKKWLKKLFKEEKILLIQRPKGELILPSAEEMRGWLGMSCGKHTKSLIVEKIEELKDDWANGQFTGSTTEETIQLNSEAVGKVQAYADILLTLEEMCEDTREEEDEG